MTTPTFGYRPREFPRCATPGCPRAAEDSPTHPTCRQCRYSLADFVATRRFVDDIGPILTYDPDLMGKPGVIYDDGFWIQGPEPVGPFRLGKYYLLLERSEYISDDLGELEAKLYEWWLTC